MAFIMLRVELPNKSVGDCNTILQGGPHEAIKHIQNMLSGVQGGQIGAQIDAAVRNSTQTITAADGGDTGSYNKL